MNFGKIDNIILFGGSSLLAELVLFIKRSKKYSVACFSCDRQLKEVVGKRGETLEELLQKSDVSFYSSEDVCKNKQLHSLVTKTTLGLGFGEPWTFNKATIDEFGGKLLDFMGIRLPQYRGGAHYSWQIMRKNRIGACNLQIINEEMVQGVFDSGQIIKSREYFFPSTAKIPQDYFNAAALIEISFLKEFLREVENGQDFELTKVQENFSIYFPRLYTLKHGFVNWLWSTDDILTFICAFDDPYKGASTFINDRRVFLKDCYAEFNDGPFHPFQAGLIYKKNREAIFVATVDGTIIAKKVLDVSGEDLKNSLKVGERLFTPTRVLEESMHYDAVYDAKGIVES